MPSSPKAYFPNLDLLRFAAAAWVILFHYFTIGPIRNLTGYAPPGGILRILSEHGYMGVCLFFIVSGFVISLSAENASPASFIAGRIGRIMPGFMICMTLSTLLINLAGAPDAPGFAVWFANLFILPQIFGQPFVDAVYWSLVYEVLFYGWVALFVWLGLVGKHLATICWVWLAIAVCDRFFVQSVVLERVFITEFTGFFVIGAALYLLDRKQAGWRGAALLVGGIVLGVEGLATFGIVEVDGVPANPPLSLDFRLASTLAMAGAVLFALAAPQLSRFARAGFVLGGISYPLYLLHHDVGYAILRLRPEWVWPEAMGLTLAAVMVLVCWLIFRFAESPVRRALRPLLESTVATLLPPGKKGAAEATPPA